MANTVLVELNNSNALNLLYDLEKMNVLRVLKNNSVSEKINFSEKFKGFLPKAEGEKFKDFVNKSREEWNSSLQILM